MTNIIDYIKWHGDLSFNESKINIIDLYILTILPIFEFDNIAYEYDPLETNPKEKTIGELTQQYFSINKNNKDLGLLLPPGLVQMLKELGKSKRFKDITTSNYINVIDYEKEEQFSAMVFHFPNSLLISYSGTDDTIIGWKENFNMLTLDKIPSQTRAEEYSKYVFKTYKKPVITSGHSKGGNMAIFGGMAIPNEYLLNVLAFDAPGVNEKVSKTLEYQTILPKLKEFIPEESIIGRLFIHKSSYYVVKSNKKGIYQHDPLSWRVMGKDFIYSKSLSKEAIEIDKKIKTIISEMTEEEKIGFGDALYKIFTKPNVIRLKDLEGKTFNLVSAYFKLDRKDKKVLHKPLLKLLKEKYFQRSLFKSFKEFREAKREKKKK